MKTQTIVPLEDMYREKKGVPQLVGISGETIKDIQERVNVLPIFDSFEKKLPVTGTGGCFELCPDEPIRLLEVLSKADVSIEEAVKREICSCASFITRGATPFAIVLVEVSAATLGFGEYASYGDVLHRAVLCGLQACEDSIPCSVALRHARAGVVPEDPYVVFARCPSRLVSAGDPILFTLEVKSRTWGGVTLGAVNGALDFVSPGRKYIFAKYTRL